MSLFHSVFLPQITVSVEGLPSLRKGEAYSCFFQDTEAPASLTNTGVICSTPDASSLPPISHGDGEFFLYLFSNCTQGVNFFLYLHNIQSRVQQGLSFLKSLLQVRNVEFTKLPKQHYDDYKNDKKVGQII